MPLQDYVRSTQHDLTRAYGGIAGQSHWGAGGHRRQHQHQHSYLHS